MSEIENKTIAVGSVPTTAVDNVKPSAAVTFSTEEESDFGLVEDGTYEVTLEADKSTTKTGKEVLNLKFRIRKDVEQKFQNRIIFETLFKDKTNPLWFDLRKMRKIVLTQENPKLDFQEVDECIQYINGINLKVDVETYTDTNNVTGETKDRNRIKYLSYTPSTATLADNVAPSITDNDDLPF